MKVFNLQTSKCSIMTLQSNCWESIDYVPYVLVTEENTCSSCSERTVVGGGVSIFGAIARDRLSPATIDSRRYSVNVDSLGPLCVTVRTQTSARTSHCAPSLSVRTPCTLKHTDTVLIVEPSRHDGQASRSISRFPLLIISVDLGLVCVKTVCTHSLLLFSIGDKTVCLPYYLLLPCSTLNRGRYSNSLVSFRSLILSRVLDKAVFTVLFYVTLLHSYQ